MRAEEIFLDEVQKLGMAAVAVKGAQLLFQGGKALAASPTARNVAANVAVSEGAGALQKGRASAAPTPPPVPAAGGGSKQGLSMQPGQKSPGVRRDVKMPIGT